jgi:hypothetical protein
MNPGSHRLLLGALFGLFAILASTTAYGSTVVAEVEAGSLAVWALRGLASLFFLLGIVTGTLALLIELVPSSRGQKAVEVAVAVPAIVVLAAVGVVIGGGVGIPYPGDGSASERFAVQLNHVISGASQERDADIGQLRRADTRGKQAKAAKALAKAFSRREEMALRIPTASAADLHSTRRIAAGLRLVAMAYEELEGAVLDPAGSQTELDGARIRVSRAEGRLLGSQMALAGRGYLVVSG